MANAKRLATDEKKEKRSRWLILLLLLLLLIAIGVTLWALFFRDRGALTPDYAPRDEDKHAQALDEPQEDKMAQSEGGGAVSLTYTTGVTIDISEEQATLYFANPSKSNQDIVLQLMVQDVLMAQSGRLSPGKQLGTLDLLDGMAERLEPGGYSGKFVVLFYQPDTHEKTILNTEIPVEITVVE